MKKNLWLPMLLVLIAAAVGVGLLWRSQSVSLPKAPPPVASAPAEPPVVVASAPASGVEPVILHPIETPVAAPPLGPGDIAPALIDLLGRKAAATFLQTDDFARRFVATVDNLGREHAAPMLWPINPMPGRFTVETRDGSPVIAADNGMRYTAFVLLVETVDMGRAVDLYVHMYPMLQHAYEDLGYPKAYFNDRFIAVIDKLLQTPDAAYPIKVELTEVKGPIRSERPWVRYQFVAPEYQSLSAGQKMLMRSGAVNERRLKAKLSEIRQQLVKRAAGR